MKLRDYLITARLSQNDFAGLSGVRQSHISRLCQGRAEPSLALARRIMQLTRGAVTPNDFLALPADTEAAE